MLNFELYNPVKVVFGPGTSKEIGKYATTLGKKALVVTYENPTFFADLLANTRKSLEENGVEMLEFYQIKANPHVEDIRDAVEICRKNGVDLVIGIGGGSVMDSAKIIAAGVLYKDDVWKMFVTRHDIEVAVPPTETLPSILVPTLPATSSEMNCVGVATNQETKEKAYVWSPVIYSKISIMDPELTCSLPAFQTACGAVDAISHVLEAYLNGDQFSPVQDRTQEGLVRAIMDELPLVLKDPSNVKHRSNIQWASTLTWNGWLQAGLNPPTPMHQMGHVLSARYNVAHGVTLAIFMNSYFRYTCTMNDERAARFALLAENVMCISRNGRSDKELAEEFVAKFIEFMKSVGVPTTLTEAGVPAEDIEDIANDIVRHGCDSNGNLPSIPPIGHDGIVEILKMSL